MFKIGVSYEGTGNVLTGKEEGTNWQEAFPGIDPLGKKVQILVVPADVCETPCASNTGIVLNPGDMELTAGEWAAVHELSHCIHMRNYVSLNRVLMEAFAIDTTEIFN